MENIITLTGKNIPQPLQELPDAPTKLYLRGSMPQADHKLLAVVGARRHTAYGAEVTKSLIKGLADYPISIVSGLALGIDGIAHQAALSAGLHTLAIPGSGLNDSVLYPASHRGLAEKILLAGGGLLSEYEPGFKATSWSFPKRNRLMAGLSDAVLVIEAETKSGTLITSRLATEYNREVLAVPGSIFSPLSAGPHMLIRLGATPIRSAQDILDVFNLTEEKAVPTVDLSDEEKVILKLIETGASKDAILSQTPFTTGQTQAILLSLELKGVIKDQLGVLRVT